MKLFHLLFTFLILTGITLEAKKISDEERLEEVQKLSLTIQYIEALYVEDNNFSDTINNFIRGGVAELDPHSSFLDEKELRELTESTKGEFGGLGFIVTKKDKVLTIVSPIDDTPAFKAGIKSGDVIIKINGESALDLSLSEAVKIMRGKPGTKITLTMYRKSAKEPIVFNLERAIINVKSVKYKKYNDYLYLRISSFDEKVSKSIRKILKKKEMKKIKGIILDLRNNPGGLLVEAVNTTDIFIPSNKVVVSSKGKLEANNYELLSKTDNIFYENIPLVVLVNAGSASASEIVSGSLQDNKRAIVVGTQTFGKGTIQQIFKLNKKEAIKITVGKYYLPSGRTIQNKGVMPDVIVDYVVKEVSNNLALKESDFKKSLKEKVVGNKNKKTIKPKKQDTVNKFVLTKEEIKKDLCLKTGIDILNTLNIMKK
jgi:carboxyl-terminal processing protease